VAARRRPTEIGSAFAPAMMPSAGLIVRREARDLRRAVRPVVWVVLEEVVLDAVAGDGGLVAATSARSIAWRLGLDPGTAASALRTLRDRASWS
jgi:hypothetical protein